MDRRVAGRRPDRAPVADWTLSRYDLVLALIPLAFGIATFAGALFEVTLPTSMAAASVLGLGLILDTVFRNPPVTGGDAADR